MFNLTKEGIVCETFLQDHCTCLLLYAASSGTFSEDKDWIGSSRRVRREIYQLLGQLHKATKREYGISKPGAICVCLAGTYYQEFRQRCNHHRNCGELTDCIVK